MRKYDKKIKAHYDKVAEDEIELSSKDKNRPLQLNKKFIEIRSKEKKDPDILLFLKDKIDLTQYFG